MASNDNPTLMLALPILYFFSCVLAGLPQGQSREQSQPRVERQPTEERGPPYSRGNEANKFNDPTAGETRKDKRAELVELRT